MHFISSTACLQMPATNVANPFIRFIPAVVHLTDTVIPMAVCLQCVRGELGFFRIRMYRHNLGIERTCSWADPNPNPVPVNELSTLMQSHSARASPDGATGGGFGLKGSAGAIQQVVSVQPSGLADGVREASTGEEGSAEGRGEEEEVAVAAAAAVTHSRLLVEHRKHPCLRRSAVPLVSAFCGERGKGRWGHGELCGTQCVLPSALVSSGASTVPALLMEAPAWIVASVRGIAVTTTFAGSSPAPHFSFPLRAQW